MHRAWTLALVLVGACSTTSEPTPGNQGGGGQATGGATGTGGMAGVGGTGSGAGGADGGNGGVGGGAGASTGGMGGGPGGAGGGSGGSGGETSEPPDLIVTNITRDDTFYFIDYCNVGAGSGGGAFSFLVTNTDTSQSFQSPVAFSVPAAGNCQQTGGLICNHIGDSFCTQSIAVEALIDDQDTVAELDETNNSLTVQF